MTVVSARAEWAAISDRIRSLAQACESMYRSLEVYSEDSGTIKASLVPEANECYAAVQRFCADYGDHLPELVRGKLENFLSKHRAAFAAEVPAGGVNQRLQAVRSRLAALQALNSAIEYGLSNPIENVQHVTERAFVHLQRRIVAEKEYRAQWSAAFAKDELSCESLGAIHLLWHGIWAFKVSAGGGRTDLVLGNQIDDPAPIRRAGCGLVLTEWKRANSASDAQEKFVEARIQAAQYAVGILAGLELDKVRYVVVVTDKQVTIREDIVEDGIRYRHINIATDPEVPSRVSRKGS